MPLTHPLGLLVGSHGSGTASPGGGVFLFLLLVCVTADGDDADCGTGGVRNDNCLPLPLPGGTGSHVAPPAGDRGAAGWAAVHHGTTGRGVLLDALGSLGGADGLGRGHFTGGDISVTTKPCTLMKEGLPQCCFQGTQLSTNIHSLALH